MSFVDTTTGYAFLAAFGIAMTALTYAFTSDGSKDSFLVADRELGWLRGAVSIAASWIWAPALFVSVQIAYEKGIAGLFWFTVPNVLALCLFALFAPRIRERLPAGYTLPQYIKDKLGSARVHNVYLFPYFFYQLMAVTVQLFAGGNLVSLLTGIPLTHVMPMLALVALAYSLISGLQGSVFTDAVQMIMVVGAGAVILPLTWNSAGGAAAILQGTGGKAGITNILDPGVAFSFGIVTAIGLISGAISDQQYWQRAFSLKQGEIKKAFIFGALLFSIVPLALSTLGFLGANPALDISLPDGIDASMIGVQTVAELLPSWAVTLFVVMLLSGLSSTLDSGLSAASSLWITDVVASDEVHTARYAMVGLTMIGLAVALLVNAVSGFGLKHLWWVFNTIAACIAVPTVLSLYWDGLDERGVFWGVLTSFVIGIPLFVYANILGEAVWIVSSSLFIIAVSTGFCVVMDE